MPGPATKIYDCNGKRVSKRVLEKVKPGEMYGYDKMGTQVWNEDDDDPSSSQSQSQSQGPDNEFFEVVRGGQSAEDQPAVMAEQGAAQQHKAAQPPARPAQKGESRLNFSIGVAMGEQRCIEAMRVIENEGEVPFTHRSVSQTFDRIVSLLNKVSPMPSASAHT